MTLDILKVQESTNISQNDSILAKPTEDNKGTVKVSEQNEVMEENTPVINEIICTENVESDPNITNTMIDKFNGDTAKESIDLKPQPDEIESDNETEELVTNRRKTKKSNLFHSDSENEDESTNKIEGTVENSDNETAESEPTQHKKLKRIAIIDSDSEDEVTENSKQDSVEDKVVEYKSVDQIDLEEENNESQKKILSALCDSESSDENNEEDEDKVEDEMGISDTELEALQSTNIIPKSRKGKQKSENKEDKMTAKKALEERKEILAESQRRVRESRVSLPYHKPKPRSLKEFLQNRPKLAAPLRAVSLGQSPSLAIKMSMKQLEVITQKLKEREKEVQEFYKSESESEAEEETKNENVISEDPNEIPSVCSTDVNPSEDTSKNELISADNNLLEMMDFTDNENIIVENTDKTEITESENNIVKDEKTEEICEKTLEENSIALMPSEESEKNKNLLNDENTVSNEISSFEVEHINNPEDSNIEHELVNKSVESAEQIENQKEMSIESKKNEKIILISDIVIKPTEPNKSKNIYNLDDELLELASEVRKDEMSQADNYEFNLDDIEDESELLQYGGHSRKNKITKDELKRMKLEILEKVGVVQPRLSVGPNEIIDLEKGVAMPDEISRLRERFIRHNLKSEKHNHKKEISVMSVSDGHILKETLSFKTDENEDEDTKPLEKPGVRLQKLREELQHQMSLRRSDLWKEKLTKKSKNGNEKDDGDDDEEKSECDAMDILDNEAEEDFTDPEEDEEELEENDCDMSDKKRKKSDFVDEEAEESENDEVILNEEEALLNNHEEDDIDMMNEEEEADVEDNEEADIEDNEEADIEEEQPKKKVLKRIIKAFEDDSDDENEENKTYLMLEKIKTTKIDKESASENLLSLLETTNFKTREPVMFPEKSEDHFATPVTYMTGIKNLNTSGSRFVPPENTQGEENTQQKSQILNTNDRSNTAKISENVESQDVQADRNDDYSNSLSTQDVMAICSAEFPSSSKPSSSPEISTQQLREVFTGSMKSSCTFNTQDIGDICSGGFTGVSQKTQNQEKEVTLDDKDEHLISQLIDEDELENFKKKFESPGINSNLKTTKSETIDEVQEVIGTGGVIDSDDEETGLKLKNRKRKRLAFSDDEESSTSETAQEETIDLHDDDDEIGGNVEYDSEENEIEHNEEDETEKKKLKASDFFENEAELSESEWGSADEDERNLDDLEFEKGDEEDFDQDKLRTDIEKLQMKQMLDEDNREVKMLQELLLEDGELHGTGRQRQFRWKNIDAAGDDNDVKKEDDDDVYLEEDESEEKWRKERHEREMLKLKKESQDEEDDLIIESQSLSFTHKSLKIKSQTTFSPQVTSSEVASSPKIKQPFTLLNKRGSFLSRGEKILQKIAETSKVSFTNKNTNRIVFHTIDEDTKKRKASSANIGDSTPVAIKKLRLSGLSPALNKNKPTIAKSLFEKILGD